MRLLGLLGILGGMVLLAAFVVGIPSGINDVRLTLYLVGSVAVVIAVNRRQAARSPRLATVVAIAAIAANILYLLRAVILPDGPWHPFAGDQGLVLFYGAIALWLTDAAFGLVTWRLGVVTRWGALALAVGSTLAILGVDRLGLTSEADPTIFGPLSLIGIALNGVGLMLLGLDVALGGMPALRRRPALAR